MPVKELTFESFCARRVRETLRRGLGRRKRCCGDDVEYGESMFESMCTRRDDKSLRRGSRKCKRRHREKMWVKYSQPKRCCRLEVDVEYGESTFEYRCTRRGPRKCKRRYRGGMWVKYSPLKRYMPRSRRAQVRKKSPKRCGSGKR